MENIIAYVTGNHLSGFLWACIKMGVLGAALGFFSGLTAFLLIRKWNGYALDGRGAKWARGLVGFFTVLIFMAGFLCVGLLQGALNFTQKLVKDELAIARVCEKPCYQVSMMIAELYIAGSTVVPANTNVVYADELRRQVHALEDGSQEIDVKELEYRLQHLSETAITPIVDQVMARAIQKWPSLTNSPYQQKMERFLKSVAMEMLKKKVMTDADRLLGKNIGKFVDSLFSGLPAEAALRGNPATISVADLSTYISRQIIDFLVLGTIRDYVRMFQIFAYLAMLITLALPVGVFYIVRRRRAGQTHQNGIKSQ